MLRFKLTFSASADRAVGSPTVLLGKVNVTTTPTSRMRVGGDFDTIDWYKQNQDEFSPDLLI